MLLKKRGQEDEYQSTQFNYCHTFNDYRSNELGNF